MVRDNFGDNDHNIFFGELKFIGFGLYYEYFKLMISS